MLFFKELNILFLSKWLESKYISFYVILKYSVGKRKYILDEIKMKVGFIFSRFI